MAIFDMNQALGVEGVECAVHCLICQNSHGDRRIQVLAKKIRRLSQTKPLYGWTGCCVIRQTPIMERLVVIIATLDHRGEYR